MHYTHVSEVKRYLRWLIGLLWCNFIFRHGRFRFVISYVFVWGAACVSACELCPIYSRCAAWYSRSEIRILYRVAGWNVGIICARHSSDTEIACDSRSTGRRRTGDRMWFVSVCERPKCALLAYSKTFARYQFVVRRASCVRNFTRVKREWNDDDRRPRRRWMANNSCALPQTKTYLFFKMRNYRGIECGQGTRLMLGHCCYVTRIETQVLLRWRQQHSWHRSGREYCFRFDLND